MRAKNPRMAQLVDEAYENLCAMRVRTYGDSTIEEWRRLAPIDHKMGKRYARRVLKLYRGSELCST